jgi:hypothetical protein
MMIVRVAPFAAAFFTAAIMASTANAGEMKVADASKLDACIESVSLIGAQIRHKEVTRADGSPAYEFVVRSSTANDYRVICDAKTGMLGDVSPIFGGAG